MNYYERHLGDYAKDTAHLSMLEHGAYNLLLDRYYGTEAGIPADQVYRVARARTKDERAAVDAVLGEFFELKDGAWTKGRCDEEIEKAKARIDAARENGKKGGRPKAKPNPDQTQKKPNGLLPGSNSETQSKALQTPGSNLQDSRRGEAPPVPDPPDPRKAMFDLGVKLLGERHRGLIGKAVSQIGEKKVAEILGGMSVKPPVDPAAYFAKAIQPEERKVAI